MIDVSNHPPQPRLNAAMLAEGFCWICKEPLDGEWCHGCLRRYHWRDGGFMEEAIPLPANMRGKSVRDLVGARIPPIILLSDMTFQQLSYPDGVLPDEDAWLVCVWKPPGRSAR